MSTPAPRFHPHPLPAAAKTIGGRGYGLALGLVLGAAVLNAIIFLALLSSYAVASR